MIPLHSIQSLDDALQFMDGLDVSAMKLGLDRIRRVLDTLGNPQDSLPIVHIAGTNGKGSVTAMLASILKAAGYKTGSFISPHLVHVRERIAINGNPILPDDFVEEVAALKAHLERLNWPREDWPTYFEFLNVVAYRYFQHKGVEIAVFETGLGGRMDSTNVVRHPNLTVITTIGMDHMQHLGNTLAKIAAEKAGILKPMVPLVLGSKMASEARDVILQRAAELEAPIFEADSAQYSVSAQSSPEEGLLVEQAVTGQSYRLGLLGPYQKNNLAIVLAAVARLREQGFEISPEALAEGLAQAHWPARFQYFAGEDLLLDGSHNPDGFASLQEGLDLFFKARPLIWLVSLRCNREPKPLFRVMRECAGPLSVIVTKAQPEHLYHAPEALTEKVRQAFDTRCDVQTSPTPTEALALLRQAMRTHAAALPLGVVTGSLYTAGEILACLERVRPVSEAQA